MSRDGSIDWLCWPRFDSPSLFAALLDPRRGGRFRVGPAGAATAARRYAGDTNVLETTFDASTGRLRLTDLMPVAAEEIAQSRLVPEHELLRIIECTEGEVDVEIVCDPRPGYGRAAVRFADSGRLGFFGDAGGGALVVRSEVPLALDAGRPGLHGRMPMRRGDRRCVSLSWDSEYPAVLSVLGDAAGEREAHTRAWWREWAAQCVYDGPYRPDVMRSALALKLMTFAPSGAVIAAPTTSLPEHPGGGRNWDYRYCWLRDASMTVRALFGLGYNDEGQAFISWLLHATRLTQPELQVLYDVYGESRLPERELALAGYRDSRPVRVGNGAADQLQLDVYGEVVDAVHRFVERGGSLDRATARTLIGLGRTVCRRWREPDEGIWEIRSERRHHTLSKAMCWVALDRLLALHRSGHLRVPEALFTRERDDIRALVEAHGYNARLGSYVSVLDGDEVDASLMLLALCGYADPASPRMAATCRRIHERLAVNGFVYRYRGVDDGLSPGEGAFGIASFWAVECRALSGDVAGARRDFERACGAANDVGLMAEEVDPATGAALGNFPQAFSHVGLINAALTLAACERNGTRR